MIRDQIKEEVKEAMRAKNQDKLTVLRGLLSAFTNELVANGKTPQDEISDDEALAVIKRASKQRKDAIDQFTKGGRPELAEDEQKELGIIEAYLPQMMSQDEIRPTAEKKKEEMGVTDKSGMGQLMGAIMAELKGQADGGDVKEVVESLFK